MKVVHAGDPINSLRGKGGHVATCFPVDTANEIRREATLLLPECVKGVELERVPFELQCGDVIDGTDFTRGPGLDEASMAGEG